MTGADEAAATEFFVGPPSAVAYMARALIPRRRRATAREVPPLRAVWSPATVPPCLLAEFQHFTGLGTGASLPILFPQAWGFRLLMAVLTNHAFPLPVWNALQIRNRLVQHRLVEPGAVMSLEARTAGRRALEKGLEVDLQLTAHVAAQPVWESLTTFYYRGSMSGSDTPSPLAASPATPHEEVARWHAARDSAWRFGRVTGDFNGIHWSDAYARLFRFPGALHHPQRVVGQCLARLPPSLSVAHDAPRQRLDVWLKGPIFYDRTVVMQAARSPGTTRFALRHDGDERPAVIGEWSRADRAPGLP